MKVYTSAVVVLLAMLLLSAAPTDASDVLDSLPVTGVVQHLVLPGYRSKTFISLEIGRAFRGKLPGSVDRIMVEGPGGLLPVSLEDFRYVARSREFWATLPGPPQTGHYEITVHAGRLSGVVSASVAECRAISPPFSLTVQKNEKGLVSTNRPAFSWKADSGNDPCYYQLQIKNASGEWIYQTAFSKDAFDHHPLENVLAPGSDYSFRVRSFDQPKWAAVQNRAQSGWVPFRTDSRLDYDYRPPETTDDGWATRDIQAAGLDPAPVNRMFEGIINHEINDVHGVLLIVGGDLMVEEYFGGYGRDDLHLVASVTKSVNSLLFGQAMDRGLIEDIESSALDYFPEYDNPADVQLKKKIKLRHVLTMTAGLEWDYLSVPLESPEYDTRKMMASGDPIGFILGRKVVAPPGSVYNYCDGLALMLGEIVHRVSGMPVGRAAESWLFKPLGIRDYFWEVTENGVTATQGGLFLRPRDMGKIGQLVLQDGLWNQERVVSRKWIRASTREYVKGDGKGYGYQWRTTTMKRAGRDLEVVWASGYGGQRIFIVREMGLVAVVTSKVLYNPGGGILAEHLFVSNILPAVSPVESPPPRTGSSIPPEKVVGCYHNESQTASGCIEHHADGFKLKIKSGFFEETCRLEPVSDAEFWGRSSNLGDFHIMINWTESGEFDSAVFHLGLRRMIMKRDG